MGPIVQMGHAPVGVKGTPLILLCLWVPSVSFGEILIWVF
jgi:hypothetical protein